MTNLVKSDKTVIGLLEKAKDQLAKCLPKHLTAERLTRLALTEFRKNPKLQECEPVSFLAAVMTAGSLGLEPGMLGHCYLVPYKNTKTGKIECNLMIGYKGLLELAMRSGKIMSIIARPVYENDKFEYHYGLKQDVIHTLTTGEPGALTHVYAVVIFKDGHGQFDVMTKTEVDRIRDTFSKSKNFGPWVTHYEEMAKKTVARRLFKWLPCSIEMQKAVSLDEQQEIGIQDIKAIASEEFDTNFIEENNIGSKKSDKLLTKLKNIKNNDELIEKEA